MATGKKRNRWLRRQSTKHPLHSHTDSINLLNVHVPGQVTPIAQVTLNGYNIEKNVSLGDLGAIRSFKVISGSLWDFWSTQETLLLRDQKGNEIQIKIAALPTDDNSAGLIEFIL